LSKIEKETVISIQKERDNKSEEKNLLIKKAEKNETDKRDKTFIPIGQKLKISRIIPQKTATFIVFSNPAFTVQKTINRTIRFGETQAGKILPTKKT